MVAKISSGKSIRGIVLYNERKVEAGGAELILASGFAGEISKMVLQQKLNRFNHLTVLNAKVKTNALHISLNFHPSDKPSDGQLQAIASEYMEAIGFGGQPYLVYKHLDSGHPHVHVVSTLIQRDASRIDIHGIGYRLSEPCRKALEVKYGLIKAQGEKDISREVIGKLVYGQQPTKRAVSNLVSRVSREYAYTSFAAYKAVLGYFGVLADRGEKGTRMFENQGLQYFLLDTAGRLMGVPIKASAIYAKPTLANLEKRFALNLERKDKAKGNLKALLEGILKRPEIRSIAAFESALQSAQVGLVLHQGTQGQVFGLTYIDIGYKCVFNGSELGKAFSAKAILEKFHDRNEGREKMEKLSRPVPEGNRPEVIKPGASAPLLEILMKPELGTDLALPGKKRKKRKKQKQSLSI